MAKKTKKQTQETEVTRGPGRPPGIVDESGNAVPLKNHMIRLPLDMPDVIGQLSSARGMTRGAYVANLIRREQARIERNAARRKTTA